jgi:hypothetical protein
VEGTSRFYPVCLQEHEIEPGIEGDRIQGKILVPVTNNRREKRSTGGMKMDVNNNTNSNNDLYACCRLKCL